MEEGSSNREELEGEKGALEGGLLGGVHWSRGALRSAGEGLGWLEDREEGTWENDAVFKWAMIDGLGGDGNILGASLGRGGGT